ncbi:AbrB family transcriptional regulator [Trichormus variabilis]|nr:AbrB family transcriptional regulator [Trichormus variabilis]MBD2628317.1 AbrB family transcriptional regulator [Trichormus variabilis FACHB-164]
MFVELHLKYQDQLVISVSLRKSLGFESYDILIAHLEEGRLILEKQETIKRRLKARFSQLPKGISLADELVAERGEKAYRKDTS